MYFVKSWTIYPVSVYVKENRCNETRFVLFNTFGKFFPFFMLSLLCKGYYVELLCFGEELKVQESQKGYCMVGHVLGCDRGFPVPPHDSPAASSCLVAT